MEIAEEYPHTNVCFPVLHLAMLGHLKRVRISPGYDIQPQEHEITRDVKDACHQLPRFAGCDGWRYNCRGISPYLSGFTGGKLENGSKVIAAGRVWNPKQKIHLLFI